MGGLERPPVTILRAVESWFSALDGAGTRGFRVDRRRASYSQGSDGRAGRVPAARRAPAPDVWHIPIRNRSGAPLVAAAAAASAAASASGGPCVGAAPPPPARGAAARLPLARRR